MLHQKLPRNALTTEQEAKDRWVDQRKGGKSTALRKKSLHPNIVTDQKKIQYLNEEKEEEKEEEEKEE